MKYAFTNGIILDGTEDMQPAEGMTVLVEDDKIVDIVPDFEPTGDCEVIDLEGAYLMPGLIDLHVHLATSGKPPKEGEGAPNYKQMFNMFTGNKFLNAALKQILAGYVLTELFSGVTTIRTVGGVLDYDARLRDEIDAGEKLGPRILAGNTGISVPGGHLAGSIATESVTLEQAVADVRRLAEFEPDLIKIMITGGVMDADVEGEPGVLRMPPEIVKAVCDEAHRLGLKVAAHVESPDGVRVALENGVDTVEHGARLTDETVRLFKEKGAAHICTISPALPYSLFELSESHAPMVAKRNGDIVMRGMIDCAQKCLENGIPVGLGNDVGCNFVLHYNFWRELCYFHKYVGASNKTTLHIATLGNARIAEIDDITGSIEKGKSADMIVVKGNPLDDLSVLREVSMVVMRGNLIRGMIIEKNKEVDDLLDRYM